MLQNVRWGPAVPAQECIRPVWEGQLSTPLFQLAAGPAAFSNSVVLCRIATMASAAQLADQAETELLLCNFAAAESCSRQCLALGDVGTKERALLVAIQALHETER